MKKSIIGVSLLLFAFVANGAGKYTPSTMQFMDEMKLHDSTMSGHNTLLKSINGVKCVDMFIEVTDDSVISQLEAKGAVIGVQMNGIVTATVPVDEIENMAALEGVKCLSVAQQYSPLNDKARIYTGVDKIQEGTELPQAYNGEGVIYGTFDMGVDFNHIAFKNEDKTSCIKYAYLPSNSTGTKVTGNVYDYNGNVKPGGTFPGSEFDSSKISTLTTDYTAESHGTHTMAIGAGRYMGNGYYGMAPKADIIACASPSFTDVNIINTVSYVFSKADQLNQPAVMNLSLGGNIGAHDGTSYFARLADGLTGPGKIIVLSAGNEGNDYIHVAKNLGNTTDVMKFTVSNADGRYDTFSSSIFDIWSKGDTDYTVNVFVYDKKTNTIVYTSSDLKASAKSLFLTKSTTGFNEYFTGSISLYADYRNGRYNIKGTVSGNTKTTDYRICVKITSENGAYIDAYGQKLQFGREYISGFTKGDTNKTINTLATGNNTISVGAYSTRTTGPSVSGGEVNVSRSFTVGKLASFSSYGPDDNGNNKPEVCAPGAFVISALSSYCTDYAVGGSQRDYVSLEDKIDGKTQRWGIMFGTSMASPCCAGVIATWLQANPTLTPEQVKNILATTSLYDSNVSAGGGAAKWGAGKLDGYKGLKKAIEMSSVDGVIGDLNKPLLVYPNPSNGEFEVTIPNEVGNVALNVYDMKGSLIATRDYSLSGSNTINVNLSSELTTGMYILQVKGNNTLYTSRLVIK